MPWSSDEVLGRCHASLKALVIFSHCSCSVMFAILAKRHRTRRLPPSRRGFVYSSTRSVTLWPRRSLKLWRAASLCCRLRVAWRSRRRSQKSCRQSKVPRLHRESSGIIPTPARATTFFPAGVFKSHELGSTTRSD